MSIWRQGKEKRLNVVLQLVFLVLKIKSDQKINPVILKHTRNTELPSTLTSGERKQEGPRLGDGIEEAAAWTTAFRKLFQKVAGVNSVCY